MQYITSTYGTQTGWTIRSTIHGMYVVDVTKCTKNINTDKEQLGKWDLIVVFYSYRYGLPHTSEGYTAYIVWKFIPLLNNLVITEWNTNRDAYSSIIDIYGCSSDDLSIINRDLDSWIMENLIHYHNDPIYSDATKIKYTDDSYDIIRPVITEEQAKSYAYNQLLNTYGSFYKATEREVSEYYKK